MYAGSLVSTTADKEHTLSNIEAETPVDMLTDANRRKAETLGDTLGNVEVKALVNALADTLLEVEQETLRNSFADVMTEALIDALPLPLQDCWQNTGQRGGQGTSRHDS